MIKVTRASARNKKRKRSRYKIGKNAAALSQSFARALFLAKFVIYLIAFAYFFKQYMCIYVYAHKDYMENITFYNCTTRPRFTLL